MTPQTTNTKGVTFGGLPIEVAHNLAGQKRAVKFACALYVSPAMMSLMNTATPEEFVNLCRSIQVIDLDQQEHDAEWHADSLRILAAQLNDLAKVKTP